MRVPLVIAILVFALQVHAGVVFEQPHSGTGGLLMSSRYQPNGVDHDQFVWDSFSVASAQAVTEIRWRGGYDALNAYYGGDIVNFRVSIYESTPGLSQPLLGPGYPVTPATLVAYDTGNKAGETSVGVFGGVELFDYHFVLPVTFQAQAGKLYWVQIEAEVTNGLPFWGLAKAGNGSHFRRINGQADFYFQYAPGDAVFSIIAADGPVYTVAASAAPAPGGTITNTGLYPNNSAAPLIATPNAGYAFLNWTDNGTVVSTAASYTFTVTGDRTLVANFAAGSTITTTSAPLTGGTTDGGGQFLNGSSRTVEAVASPNYTFVNWTENGAPVSANAFYTFTVAGDRNLVANFTPTATNLAIVYTLPPAPVGTLNPSAFLTPDGIDGQSFSFEKFVTNTTQDITDISWRGGFTSGSNPVVEFVLKFYASTSNGFYVDFATPVLKKVTIAGNAGQTYAGISGGVMMYDYHVTLPSSFHAVGGTTYWIQIEASQAGYPLTWGIASGSGGNNAHFRLTTGALSSNRSGDLAITLSAAAPTSYAIAATSSAAGGGSVAGAGTYALDETVTLQATADAGSTFVNWTEGAVIVSSSALYQFPAAADRTLVANFQPSYSIAVGTLSGTMGSVAGAGTFTFGSTASVTATPKSGYVFLNWKEGGNIVSTQPGYEFTVTAARTLLAGFAAGFDVAASASFAPGGSVSGAGGYATGSPVALTATPAAGYQFTHWTDSGVVVGACSFITFPANAARTLVAHFVPVVSVVQAAPGTLGFAWPASATGWVLQESPDLSPGSWTASTQTVSVSGSDSSITIPSPAGNKFFRLHHP